ncbi:MAG TPA: hypothetical protein VI357_25955 [Mycobacteriales bacterium]
MAHPELSLDERAELERLRRQVAELQAGDRDDGAPGGGRRPGRQRWRTAVAVLLIALVSLLAPLAVVAVWADRTVTDSDRYVQTVAPLIDDPAIQDALAARITAEIFTYVDVEAVTKETFDALAARGLPPRIAAQLDTLTGPIVNGVHSFVRSQVDTVVGSDAFAAAWVQANRVAHGELVKALTGQGSGTVTVADGAVSVNIASLIEVAKQQLTAAGFGLADRIPAVNAEFVLYRSADLTRIQSGFRFLDVLGVWLPIVLLVLVAIGIYVARSHRRAFIGAGLGIAGAMLALGIALTVFRRLYLDAIPPDVLPGDAAATLYETLVRYMRASLRRTAVAAVIIAAAAFLTGPSVTAVTVRRVLGSGIGALRRSAESAGLRTGQVGSWVYSYRGPLRIAVVTLAGIALILWNEPSIQVILTLTALTLLVLGIVEFLARPPAPEPHLAPPGGPAAGPADGVGPPPTADGTRLVPTNARG